VLYLVYLGYLDKVGGFAVAVAEDDDVSVDGSSL